MKLNLGLAQIATKLGDVEANLEKHLNYIKQAREQKADLVVFPELSFNWVCLAGSGRYGRIDHGRRSCFQASLEAS
jgi:predicted amidohydrolase